VSDLTRRELLKKALIMLDEAADCMDAALNLRPRSVDQRYFPLPETRQHTRDLRRLRRNLEQNWHTIWRHHE
jgi:hypothetical protein